MEFPKTVSCLQDTGESSLVKKVKGPTGCSGGGICILKRCPLTASQKLITPCTSEFILWFKVKIKDSKIRLMFTWLRWDTFWCSP